MPAFAGRTVFGTYPLAGALTEVDWCIDQNGASAFVKFSDAWKPELTISRKGSLDLQ